MADWYCKRCDKENVGSFHRCFMPGFNQIRPMKRKPSRNTPLARRLARLYESAYNEPFPGGVQNAQIKRDQLAIKAYRCDGAWVWNLAVVNSNDFCHCREFGSPWPATICAKDRTKLECGYGIPAFDGHYMTLPYNRTP